MIELKSVRKSYFTGGAPLEVLKGIDMVIEGGEMVSIMGSSGSGKSTLLNILGMLDGYDEGDYRLDGTLIKDLSEKRAAQYRNRFLGFVFQSFNLISFKNAAENVALPLYYKGVGRKQRNAMAMEMLEKVGLADRWHHLPSVLSGGQKQRVALARAAYARAWNSCGRCCRGIPLAGCCGRAQMSIRHRLRGNSVRPDRSRGLWRCVPSLWPTAPR